jgi:L-seryl-tRNA(Ser) seleniumtransferase
MRRLLLLFLMAALAFAADLTGVWDFAVETDMGSGTPRITFKQDGETLTGQYDGQLGSVPLKGTVKGNQFEFAIEVEPTGEKMTVKYKGTIDGDKVTGTIDFAGQASGKFTGTRRK